MITLKDIQKSYGTHQVLKDVYYFEIVGGAMND